MRTCSSCGRENPPDRDFCECGEYLRWEPTGFMPSVEAPDESGEPADTAPEPPAGDPADTAPRAPAPPPPPAGPAPPQPPAAQPPAPHPAAPQPPATQAPAPQAPAPVPAAGGTGRPTAGTALHGAVAPAAPAGEPAESDLAAVTLRLPDGEPVKGETLAVGVEPGSVVSVVGMIRNTSGIVDNYEIEIAGLPREWYTVTPDTVYLTPFGTSGTYEQEVIVTFQPPRTPDAEARLWELSLTARSKAHETVAAEAPLVLGIQPYTDFAAKVSPERASGRKKAHFTVTVDNKANSTIVVGLGVSDADGELDGVFETPQMELAPGQTAESELEVRPPKQIWLGRPMERRMEILARTGEEGEALIAGHPVTQAELEEHERATGEPAPKAKGAWKSRLPVVGPRLARPRLSRPSVSLGPGGPQVRKPMMSGGQMAGPRMGHANLDLNKLKAPGLGGGGAPPMTGPLMPTQAIFRQKPWLPWWLAIVAPMLLVLALLLFLLLPKNAVVPDVTRAADEFEVETALKEVGLVLNPNVQEKVDREAEPGTILGQAPKAGEEVEKGTQVTIQKAVSPDTTEVPELADKTFGEAEKILREAELTRGQVDPIDAKPDFVIKETLPTAGEVVNKGKGVDLFLVPPEKAGDKGGAGAGAAGGAGAGAGAGAGGEGGEGGGEADITIPAIGEMDVDAYAQALADLGLLPSKVLSFSDSAKSGELFGADPEPGSKAAEGDTVKMLVSAGIPRVAFDDGDDIVLINGANGKKIATVSDSPLAEKDPTFTADGRRLAFVRGDRIMLADLDDPDEDPVPLTSSGKFSDPAFAPTARRNILAANKITADGNDLCLGVVNRDGWAPKCFKDKAHSTSRVIRWAPDGDALFAFAVKERGTFGMVAYATDKAFSANPDNWEGGDFVTDIETTDKGVIDLAVSPDGERMAVVSNLDSDAFQLSFTVPGDFDLEEAKVQPVLACKADWRSDSLELIVAQGGCSSEVADELVRVPVRDPRRQTSLKAGGDNPVFQPARPESAG